MSYRPYPSPDRARHQVERHAEETPPMLWAPRPLSPFTRQLFEGAATMMREAQPSGDAFAAKLRAAFQQRPHGSEAPTA